MTKVTFVNFLSRFFCTKFHVKWTKIFWDTAYFFTASLLAPPPSTLRFSKKPSPGRVTAINLHVILEYSRKEWRCNRLWRHSNWWVWKLQCHVSLATEDIFTDHVLVWKNCFSFFYNYFFLTLLNFILTELDFFWMSLLWIWTLTIIPPNHCVKVAK